MIRGLTLILWKNCIIRKRHWFLTLCEVAIPVLLFALVAYARSQAEVGGKQTIEKVSFGSIRNAQNMYEAVPKSDHKLFYVPNTNFTSSLIELIRDEDKLGILYGDVKGFPNKDAMFEFYRKYASNISATAIIFNGNVSTIPKKLDYDIRFFEKNAKKFQTDRLFLSSERYIPEASSVTYMSSGFLGLQLAIDLSYIQTVYGNKELPVDLTFQEDPYPPHEDDGGFNEFFMYSLPFVTAFSFMLLCPAVIKRVSEEKFTGIKELMKMSGLKSWMLWLGWFLHGFLVNCLSVVLIVMLMKEPFFGATDPPIMYCSSSVLAVFLILYCAACIVLCFAISSLINKPTLAMVFGILVWMATIFLSLSADKLGGHKRKMLTAVFPNMALFFGFQALSVYERGKVVATWDNLGESLEGATATDLTMSDVMFMLIVDIVIYMIITVYLDGINPGEYGIAKPWHYPISSIYSKFSRDTTQVGTTPISTKIEEAPLNLQPGIRLQNVYKKYGKNTVVDGVSIDIYKDQITALLGYNGAGKTTTMLIITGMVGATKGDVFINGYNIKKKMGKIRSSLGLCPQHNLLSNDLTAMEHVMFFAMLKGMSKSKAKKDATDLLRQLNMYENRNKLAKALSGGMKRKLCLAMAVVGNAKVLILDEPTAGMDPEARRLVWDLLLSWRGSRTILLTTHFMEEADYLGDRIAIMDHGRIACYGTSMYLKNEYGTGYHLTIVCDEQLYRKKNKKATDPKLDQVNAITRTVRGYVSAAELMSENGNLLLYLLPIDKKSSFPGLLQGLEGQKDSLCIMSISMAITTMEEVFLKAGEVSDRAGGRYSRSTSRASTSTRCKCKKPSSLKRSQGVWLYKEIIKALFLKRFYVFLKKWQLQFVMFFVTLLIIWFALLMCQEDDDFTDDTMEQRFEFTLCPYGKTTVIYGTKGSRSPQFQSMEKFYKQMVESQSGVAENATDVSGALIAKSMENIVYYKRHVIASAEFDSSQNIINVMYSSFALHGAPISLNLVTNSILKGLAGPDFSIATANAPLRINSKSSPSLFLEIKVGLAWTVLLPLALLFFMGIFIIFPQLERGSNMLQLQYMCGIRAIVYWLCTYIFDLLVFVFMTAIVLLFITIYESFTYKLFSQWPEIGILFLIMLCYALCALPFTYLFSYKKTIAGAFSTMLMLGLFVGIILLVIVYVMLNSGDAYYVGLGKELKFWFLFLPQFGLALCSLQFSRKVVKNYNWHMMDDKEKPQYCMFDWNPCCDGEATPACSAHKSYMYGNDLAVGPMLQQMALSALIFGFILLVLESNFLWRLYDCILGVVCDVIDKIRAKNSYNVQTSADASTQAPDEEPLLEATNLQKRYGCTKVVKGVSFRVRRGDCFGLLGVNGAGKTTTFRMLTGDAPLTYGTAKIRGASGRPVTINRNTTAFLKNMGYCPQFNAINEVLTGRQTLEIFGMLRGVPENAVKWVVEDLLEALELKEFADKRCGDYSGGNKRKLCIGIALIGNPPLILLDEPTSGVDPLARRKIWDALSSIKQNIRSSIILTSHSMEECEALCNKLAIMKQGVIFCQDTIPRLKQEYGKGYTIVLKIKSSGGVLEEVVTDGASSSMLSTDQSNTDLDNVVKAMKKAFGKELTLRDRHATMLHYQVADQSKNWSWSSIFSQMETLKKKVPVIEDYIVSEASLEDVFLSVAEAEVESDNRTSERRRRNEVV